MLSVKMRMAHYNLCFQHSVNKKVAPEKAVKPNEHRLLNKSLWIKSKLMISKNPLNVNIGASVHAGPATLAPLHGEEELGYARFACDILSLVFMPRRGTPALHAGKRYGLALVISFPLPSCPYYILFISFHASQG